MRFFYAEMCLTYVFREMLAVPLIEKIDSVAKNSLFGDKTTLPTKEYGQLKKMALSAIKEKQNLYKYRKASSEKIGDLEATMQFADQKIEKLEGKNEKLEKEVAGLQKHRVNEIVFKSMLQDDNRNLNISQTEINRRIILFNLESGQGPEDLKEGERWTSTLEENKRLKTIPQSRLQRGLEKLKVFIDKLLGRNFSMDSVLQQAEKEKSKKPKSKKKSHDMEL